jgi:hypothetical protein
LLKSRDQRADRTTRLRTTRRRDEALREFVSGKLEKR